MSKPLRALGTKVARPIIAIPQTGDSKFSYLSINSPHPFIENDKYWSTVSHYMMAKQFEGTLFEDLIRKARSVTVAKIMTRPRQVIIEDSGTFYRKIVYGTTAEGDGYTIREDWGDVRVDYLKAANKYKFDQNGSIRKHLLDTEGMKIIDSEDRFHGEILEELRDNYILESLNRSSNTRFTLSIIDLKSGVLTAEESTLITGIIKLAGNIHRLEGVRNVYPEMFEDALENITGAEVIEKMCQWITSLFTEWSDIVKKMPAFDKIVSSIDRLLATLPLGKDQSRGDRLRIAAILATFIRWKRIDYKGPSLIDVIGGITKSSIIIPPRYREYRKEMPIRIVSPKKTSTKIPFKGFDLLGIEFSQTGGKITLRGSKLLNYKPQLMSVRAIFVAASKGTVPTARFAESKLREVESKFLSEVPADQRSRAVYTSWWQSRGDILVDLTKQISDFSETKECADHAKLALRIVYSESFRGVATTSQPLEEFIKVFGVSKAIGKILFSPLYIPDETLGSLSVQTYSEYFKTFDGRCRLLRKMAKDPTTGKNAKFTNFEYSLLESIKWIVECSNSSLEAIDFEGAIWGFLTVCSKTHRPSAKKYIASVVNFRVFNMDESTSITYLSSRGVYSDLNKIRIAIDAAPSMLFVMAIALTFMRTRCDAEMKYRVSIFKPSSKAKISQGSIRNFSNQPLGDFSPKFHKPVLEDVKNTPDKESIAPHLELDEELPPLEIIEVDTALSASTAPVIREMRGHIIRTAASYIITITNSTSSKGPSITKSEAVTLLLYKTYPYANVFSTKRNLGESVISYPLDKQTNIKLKSTRKHRYVVTLIAEQIEGGPKRITDTANDRYLWFSKALTLAAKEIPRGSSIAISKETLQPNYRDVLEKIATSNNYSIVIYSPASEKGTTPLPSSSPEVIPPPIQANGITNSIPTISPAELATPLLRNIFYAKILKDHILATNDYSKFMKRLESFKPPVRKLWLEKFIAGPTAQQLAQIRLVLNNPN